MIDEYGKYINKISVDTDLTKWELFFPWLLIAFFLLGWNHHPLGI
jgi:hypothetical protein